MADDRNFTHIDCFAGPGGICTGLTAAGFHTLVAIEYIKTCCETYSANHPDVHVIHSDIRKVTAEQILPHIPEGGVDLVTSGMPCETFSTAGNTSRSFYDDRQFLFREGIRIAKICNSRFLLFENVPGITSKRTQRDSKTLIVDVLKRELEEAGYDNYIEIITENEFNIERLYKLLFNLNLEYEPDTKRKVFIARIKNNDLEKLKRIETISDEEELKAVVRGAFLGSGSVNNPNKKYHLEILLNDIEKAIFLQNIIKKFEVNTKILKTTNTIYIKEGEEISKFLALIGATKSVLSFEEIRVVRETRNNVNRLVNCETANLNKIVNASIKQVEAIKFLKKMKKFDTMPKYLIEIAELRLENPEIGLKDLGKMLENPIGKSGVNHRLKKIQEYAEEIKKGN